MVGGGDHWGGAGGFSGGIGESGTANRKMTNGGEMEKPEVYTTPGDGGSYFFSHRYDGRGGECLAGMIGGQGGQCKQINWWCDAGGDGGVAGKGGTIKVSKLAKVYAYNGNRYTDGKSEHEYNSNTASLYQCPIFIQNGILREVYKINAWWGTKENYNYQYFNNIFGSTIAPNVDKITSANNIDEIRNVKIREEITENVSLKIKNGYQNTNLLNKPVNDRSVIIKVDNGTKTIDMVSQGVGSGAGYIEISNGTYTVDESKN